MTIKKIPFFTLEREYRLHEKHINAAVTRVLRSQQFILGRETELFEKEFAAYLGVRHAIGVGSGTDGLILALLAVGIKKGDEVITQANSFVATAEAISFVGAKAVFVDINPATYQIDMLDLSNKITKRTKAIIPVHMYGAPGPIREVITFAKKNALFVIEDACQAHGATFEGKKLGTFGDIGVFSFYPSKNLGAYGDAGCVVTNSASLQKSIAMMRNHGQKTKYFHDTIGINSRLDEIQAAVLRIKLHYLEKTNDEHRKNANLYQSLLTVKMQEIIPGGNSNYYVFVIQIKKRNLLQEFLKDVGIETMIHYPVPIHLQRPFSQGYKPGSLPITEGLAKTCLSLPLFTGISPDEVKYVSEKVNSFQN